MIIRVKVIPKASKNEVVGLMDDGTWKLKVAAVPEKGKANEAVCKLLAAHFKVPITRVSVISGQTSSFKHVRIHK
jgi:uncharacterized protein (TIGR00251 family)